MADVADDWRWPGGMDDPIALRLRSATDPRWVVSPGHEIWADGAPDAAQDADAPVEAPVGIDRDDATRSVSPGDERRQHGPWPTTALEIDRSKDAHPTTDDDAPDEVEDLEVELGPWPSAGATSVEVEHGPWPRSDRLRTASPGSSESDDAAGGAPDADEREILADDAAIDAFLEVAADEDTARIPWRQRREQARVRRRLARARRRNGNRSRVARGALAVVAIALVVGVVAIGVLHEQRLAELEQQVTPTLADVAAEVRAQADTTVVSLTTDRGVSIPVFVDGTGRAYLYGSALPVLPRSRTYRLWGATDEARVPLAILGADPGVEVFRLPEDVGSLAITDEPVNGSASATSGNVAFGELPR